MINFKTQRQKLVNSFIAPVVANDRVVAAFQKVPRHRFVPKEQQDWSYQDWPLSIGQGQTISQPSLVALMTQALKPQSKDRVLEVGTGSGYQAAILAQLVSKVYTIERLKKLANKAKETLDQLGYQNIKLKIGDGSQGWPDQAPFDGIIVSAAAPNIPQPLVNQLADHGRLVIPISNKMFGQQIKIVAKEKGRLRTKATIPVRFVPLIGKYGYKK